MAANANDPAEEKKGAEEKSVEGNILEKNASEDMSFVKENVKDVEKHVKDNAEEDIKEDIRNEKIEKKREEMKMLKKKMHADEIQKGRMQEEKKSEEKKSFVKTVHTLKQKPGKISSFVREIYINKHKSLFAISVIIFLLCVGLLIFNSIRTGELFKRDISLKGGISVTISKPGLDAVAVENIITKAYPNADVNVRILRSAGAVAGVIIESSDLNAEDIISILKSGVSGLEISESEYSIETMGSALGEAFFRQATTALLLAFLFMAVTVFIYFRNIVPSLFIVWCAFSDIVSTLAIVSIFNIKMSSASIAALLMLIGYSVDTDILLTARVLKEKHMPIIERILGSLKTGILMTLTTIGALIVGFLLAQSEIIKQIMLILLIGLSFDMLYTWITNANVLRMYVEAVEKKKASRIQKR